MRTMVTRCFSGILVASLPVALCACPPENTAQSFDGPTGAPGVVDMKSYWPMAKGNTWFLEDKNWKHVTICLEDYWVASTEDGVGPTEVCKMRNELTDKWGTQVTEYHLLWKDDYVVLVEEEAANNVDFLAGLGFVPPQFPGVSILMQRYVDDAAIDQSHVDDDNVIYHQTTVIDAVNQLLCGNSAKPISPELYPLPASTEVLLQRESNTIYCSAGSVLAITQIFAKGIGPISRHNLRVHIAIIFDEDANGNEYDYTTYEFNDNGYQY